MKITDSELMQAVWENQLKNLSTGVLHRYIDNKHSVRGADDEHWSAHEHISFVHHIITPLTRAHLRNRIKRLISQGLIYSGYGEKVLTFQIRSQQASSAFIAAREFWLDIGVPTGFDFDNKRMRSVHIDELNVKASQCNGMLNSIFGELESQKAIINREN